MEVQEARSPRLLRDVMQQLRELPEDHGLFIPVDTNRITLNVVCREVLIDDYLDDEIEEFCRKYAVREFLIKEQLEQIRNNLEMQIVSPTEFQIEAAIQYYWSHDAFVEVA
jgi:hypothetical protein